jgi:hypothetical protein
MDNPETQAIFGTYGTEEWTIQKHWQHWVHTTQKNGQSRNTGNIGYTRHRRMDNPKTLATLGTHDTGLTVVKKR